MKSTLAAAAIASTAAAAAFGEEGDSVALYGRVYVTAESVKANEGAAPVPSRSRLADQASYLGVRGIETLAPGVKAFFQLETQFKPEQNDTTFANRNSAVGLTTRAGSLLLGRWDTPFKWVNGDVDPFDDLTIAGYGTALQGSGIARVDTQFDRRDQNVVQYWSPKWMGFEARLSYQANEARTAGANPKSEGASITWSGKAIYAGWAYHELRDMPFSVYTSAALAIADVQVDKQTANAIFGTVKLGPVKLGIDYQEFKRSGPVLPPAMTPRTVTGWDKQKAILGNVVWFVGRHQFIYQYTKAKDGGQRNSDPSTTPASPECSANALGWRYDFSRRTFVLVEYVRVKNNATATCNFGFNSLAISPGQDPEGWSLGMRHLF
jgi:predicted porin